MLKNSLLEVMSVGLVAKDIIEDDMYVDIYPIELYPNVDGEVTTETMLGNDVTDIAGAVENIKINKSALIKAKWLPDGDTNRLEPPTVCKNELVKLFRYGDSEKYYWCTLFNELDKRKLEKRTIVLSNKQTVMVGKDELLKQTYFATMDTINKILHLHTADNDGEYTMYDIAIDTKEGMLEITDAKDNKILLESKDDIWTIKSNKTIHTITNDTINDSALTIKNNTANKTDQIDQHYQINLKTYAVNNGADELIQTTMDFVQAVIDAIGVGNAGMPVPMDGGTKSKLSAIKARYQGFK